jgi:hypothetical protein
MDLTLFNTSVSLESLQGSSGSSNDSASPASASVMGQAQKDGMDVAGASSYAQIHAQPGPSLPMRTAQLGLPTYEASMFVSPTVGTQQQDIPGGNVLPNMDFSHLPHVLDDNTAPVDNILPNAFSSSSAMPHGVPDGIGTALPFTNDPSSTSPFTAFTLPSETGPIPSFDELSTTPSIFSGGSLDPTTPQLEHHRQQQEFSDGLTAAAATAAMEAPPIDFDSLVWDQDMMNSIWANAPTDFQ